jgi:hypothetical protein
VLGFTFCPVIAWDCSYVCLQTEELKKKQEQADDDEVCHLWLHGRLLPTLPLQPEPAVAEDPAAVRRRKKLEDQKAKLAAIRNKKKAGGENGDGMISPRPTSPRVRGTAPIVTFAVSLFS